jgi:PAS domain S-box-containing protein
MVVWLSTIRENINDKLRQMKLKGISRKEFILDEIYFMKIFENNLDGVLISSFDGRILSANKSACSLFGKNEEEICNDGKEGIVDITDPNLVKLLDDRANKGKVSGVIQFIKDDGTKFKCEVFSSIFLNSKGETRIGTILYDLSEICMAETKLREDENIFHLFMEYANDGLWAWNVSSEKFVFSKKALQTLGFEFFMTFTQDEVIGFIHEEDVSLISINADLLINGITDSINLECRIKTFLGEWKWIIIRGQVVGRDKENNVIQLFGTLNDITIQKRSEEKLSLARKMSEESDRIKSAFFKNISHEIRTPMNSILGFMELLSDSSLTSKQKEEFVDIVNKSGQRLLNTLNDIVLFSRIESSPVDIHLTKENVEDILQGHYKFFKSQIENKGLIFRLNCQTEPSREVCTDKFKIDSIFINLINNAIKFTKQGSIDIGSYSDNQTIVFYVRDTGNGISSERISGIFEPFSQNDMLATIEHEGSGLGLSISKAYIEILGGNIWVETLPEKGSTFYFSIPDQFQNGGGMVDIAWQ